MEKAFKKWFDQLVMDNGSWYLQEEDKLKIAYKAGYKDGYELGRQT